MRPMAGETQGLVGNGPGAMAALAVVVAVTGVELMSYYGSDA